MPRQARIDIAGQIYHVMARGIERRAIFLGDDDRADLRERVRLWLNNSGAKCLAWCFMPNHFHLLLLRGIRPLSGIMRHIMTGYAVNFNMKHRRTGHLFQNRYKSIICSEENYLREAAPYIHLNPLRGGLVGSLEELKNYRWCGHASALASFNDGILDRRELLAHYGPVERGAAEEYFRAVLERAADGGGGGFWETGLPPRAGDVPVPAARGGGRTHVDSRILGGPDFVESVLKAAGEEREELRGRAEVLAEVERITGIRKAEIFRHSHEKGPSRARALYCYICVRDAGSGGGELMRELGITSSAVSKLVVKGRALLEKLGR